MPYRNGQLTEQEERMAQTMARTGDVAYSAHKAGYSTPQTGYKALRRAPVRNRVAALLEKRAEADVGLALDVLSDIAGDKTAGKMPRVSASANLLKAHKVFQPSQDTGEELEPHEMNVGQLARALLANSFDPTISDVNPIETPNDVPNDDIFA